ncbi:Ribosomal RNA large subunit methyltransferase G [Gossypium arboreum]|uniref:Ribosomal RNA large subunit methyltransferase G n=1 Tax=Gossypium arboreum TaxID=29729 RepID=A0A0B0NNS0_GOSAR|nr:Ribosomal RNA large subunit methyltransferase G [Gossypium arboreum]
MEKKQSKLYSLVSPYNSEFNLPFIYNQTIKKSISNSLAKCLYTSIHQQVSHLSACNHPFSQFNTQYIVLYQIHIYHVHHL